MANFGAQYLADNPDVMAAYQNNDFKANPVSATAFAKQHYDTWGSGEGRTWGSPAPAPAPTTPVSTFVPSPTAQDNMLWRPPTGYSDNPSGGVSRNNTPPKVNYTLYGGKGLPSNANATFYMKQNPDVWNAYNADTSGMSADDFAQQHYNAYGQSEGRIFGDANAGTTGTTATTPIKQSNVNSQPFTDQSIPQTTGLDLFGTDITGMGPRSSSYSGLDEESRKQLIESILPQLISSSSDLSGLADRSTQQAAELSKKTATDLAKNQLPALIDQLVAKGTLNSSFGGERALSDLFTNITRDASDKSYNAGIDAAALKQTIPSTLANVSGLGQFSEGSSTNDLASFQLLTDFISNLQR